MIRSRTAWKQGITLSLCTSTVSQLRKTMTTGLITAPSTSIVPGYVRNATSSSFIIESAVELIDLTNLTTLGISNPEVYSAFYRTRTCINTTETAEYDYQYPPQFHFYALLHTNQTNSAPGTADWIDPADIANHPENYPIMIKMHSQNVVNFSGQTFSAATMDYEDLANSMLLTPECVEILQQVLDGDRSPNLRLYWVTEAFYQNYFKSSAEQGVSIGKADGTLGFFGVYVKPQQTATSLNAVQTYFDYRVLDDNTNILGALTTVSTKPSFVIEKNSMGMAIDLELAELPNPDSDLVQLGNTVQIIRRDTNDETKKLFFDGTITRIRHSYSEQKKMVVTVTSRGNELSQYLASIYTGIPKWDFPLSDNAVAIAFSGGSTGGSCTMWFKVYIEETDIFDKVIAYAQTDAGVLPSLSNFSLGFVVLNDNGSVGDPSTATQYDSSSVSYVRVEDHTGDTIPHVLMDYSLQSTFELSSDAVGTYKWFRLVITVQDSEMTGPLVNPNAYAGEFYIDPVGSDPTAASPYSPACTIYVKGNLYQTEFTNMDPALMLKAVLDGYAKEGGNVWYKPHKIKPTGLKTDMSFNNQSMASVLNKIVEICPESYYLVYNIEDNTIELLDSNDNVDHELVMGKHINSVEAEVVSDEIINVVFFVGGVTTSGQTLYRKFVNQGSVDTYGYHPKLIVDNRVTLDSTAERIGNFYMKNKAYPFVRMNLNVISDRRAGSGLNGITGYPIENIKIGDVIRIRGLGDQEGTLWDVASFDTSYWDYNFAEVGTMYFQIGRINNQIDNLILEAESVPADINVSIRDNKRRADNIDTIDTPSVPT